MSLIAAPALSPAFPLRSASLNHDISDDGEASFSQKFLATVLLIGLCSGFSFSLPRNMAVSDSRRASDRSINEPTPADLEFIHHAAAQINGHAK